MSRFDLKNYLPRWLLTLAIIFFIFLLIFFALYLIFETTYQNKIYPGIFLGKFNLAEKTRVQTEQLLNQQINKINQTGVVFLYKNHQAVILPVIASLQSDLAYQVINFNVEQTVTAALNFGRSNNFLVNSVNKIKVLMFKQQLNLLTSLNREEIKKILKDNFDELEQPAKNAKLIVKQLKDNDYQFLIEEEKIGKIIDYEQGLNSLNQQLDKLDTTPIRLQTKTDYPTIYKKDCLNIGSKAESILNLAPITLKYNKDNRSIDKATLVEWLILKNNLLKAAPPADKIIVGLDENKLTDFLNKNIAPQINQDAVDAKFSIGDNRVTEFQASRDGKVLEIEETIARLEENIINYKDSQTTLIVKEIPSAITTENINDFGVKETVGTGESNFKGSPPNRRHNIKVGADTLSGLLIKPNEEFSLLKALGKVDASTGYLPELVIKGNKTIPEFGGGLCQIGTTIFRAALSSGLPITMRQNHSYRVVYYEPAGTDATIYDPWPDFRFINDTGNYILIQRRIEADNLYFDFWGTSDNRIATQTKPVIYNIVKPGPAKLIETLDLKPGEKKCTEKPHNGADAYFDYKVIYPNGEVKEKRFSSHYIPWQEVCLIGVEKLSTDNASSTPTSNLPSSSP